MNENEKEKFEFPCPNKNGEYVTIPDCAICKRRLTCDIYATMLDEANDR